MNALLLPNMERARHATQTLRQVFHFSKCCSDSVKDVKSEATSVLFVIQFYFCRLLYILCNHFYLILKRSNMEVFISCRFHKPVLKSNVSDSWLVIVYLTKDLCHGNEDIPKKKHAWLCLFVSYDSLSFDWNLHCLLLLLLFSQEDELYLVQWIQNIVTFEF